MLVLSALQDTLKSAWLISKPLHLVVDTLRHTFAMFYLKDNRGDLATLLGHSSLDTTPIHSQHNAEYLASWVDHLLLNAYGE